MPVVAPATTELLATIAAGTADEPVWRTLIERHGRTMRQAACLALGGAALADDAVQEALLQLPRCAGRFRPAGPEDAHADRWLQRLTINCALTLARAERRRQRRESLHAEMAMPRDEQRDDPRTEHLAQAFDGLADGERQVLLLRHVEGLEHTDLAAALGTSLSAARKRLSRAHERLRDQLLRAGCTASVAALMHKLDSVTQAAGSTAQAALWLKAASSGATPTLAGTGALVPGGMSVAALGTVVAVPVLAVTVAVGATLAVGGEAPPPADPPRPTGKVVIIGNGSGMLAYPNAQNELKLQPGDTLRIARGTYLGLSLGNLAGTAEKPITITCETGTTFTSPGGRSDVFANIAHLHFDGFRMDQGSPWVFTGASHDLRFSKFTATRSFCFRPYDANKIFDGTKASTFYNFTWEHCAFGDANGPFDGSAISSTDWQPVSNLKSVQLDFTVAHCSFRNIDYGTSGGTVLSFSRCFNLTVRDCTFSDIGYSKFIVGHNAVIGGSGYFKVYNNTFARQWANDVRMFPMKLHALGHDGPQAVTSFHNNISYEKRKYPVFEQNGVPKDDLAKSNGIFSATGSEVFFNTVYRSRRGTMTADPYRGVLVDVYAPDVVIRNNLVIDPECDAPFDPKRNYVHLLGAGKQPGIVAENNLVFRTLDEAGLVDATGFVPKAASPVRGVARGHIATIITDQRGRERYAGETADVGAVQRQKDER